jgi:hypothetical protein
MNPPATIDPVHSEPRTWPAKIISLVIVLTLITGGVLVFWGLNLLPDTVGRELTIEGGISLLTFSVTTLLITMFGTKILEQQLLTRVKSSMEETTGLFRDRMTEFVPLFGSTRRLGLDNVYLNRTDALSAFGDHLRRELDEAEDTDRDDVVEDKPRLWIVASSIKGIRDASVGEPDDDGQVRGFDGSAIMHWAGRLAKPIRPAESGSSGRLDLRILLTHPRFGDFRAAQEGREGKAISNEIKEALKFLKACGVPNKSIRFVEATPTVFAIATRTRMLLNPYPYAAEAFRSFTMIVSRVRVATRPDQDSYRDIFEQYERRHFEEPWDKGIPLNDDYGVPGEDSPSALP